MELTREQREVLAIKIRLSPCWDGLEVNRASWIETVLRGPREEHIEWLAKYAKINVT